MEAEKFCDVLILGALHSQKISYTFGKILLLLTEIHPKPVKILFSERVSYGFSNSEMPLVLIYFNGRS